MALLDVGRRALLLSSDTSCGVAILDATRASVKYAADHNGSPAGGVESQYRRAPSRESDLARAAIL